MGNENALAIINKAKAQNALVFVNQENFQSGVELYKTEATVIQSKPEEFHNLQGKFMPNRSVTDRIGEAAGVQFVAGDVRAETRDDEIAGKRTVFVATAQGKVRMPDGSWRLSTPEEYEFDPTLRAMLDKKIDYITDSNRGVFARTALEYTKVARQRAATGARLRVIRQLTGMPVSFSADDIKKPMVFTRIVQNTAHILDTKEGRLMATAQALGTDISALLFGKNAPVAPAIAEEPETASSGEPELRNAGSSDASESYDNESTPADTATLAQQASSIGTTPSAEEFQQLTIELEEMLLAYKDKLNVNLPSGVNPFNLAQAELGDFNAGIESRKSMIDRTKKFLIACKVAV